MLYLVSTPIGNLKDITLRAIEILKSCDYILCEDTRHTRILLNHYEISKPTFSYHKFNEASRVDDFVNDLVEGKHIVLVSDAGTPALADPGAILIEKSIERGVKVVPIPGPCAIIAALVASGLPTDPFQFCGFLPRTPKAIQEKILEILNYPGTTIFYEAPHRIIETLEYLSVLAFDRKIVLGREMTKQFEEFLRGTAAELLDHFTEHAPRGEIVLLISQADNGQANEWLTLTPEAHVDILQETYGLSKNDAIKLAAKQRGVPKRDVYRKVNESEE